MSADWGTSRDLVDPREARDLMPIEVNSVARTSSHFLGTSTGVWFPASTARDSR